MVVDVADVAIVVVVIVVVAVVLEVVVVISKPATSILDSAVTVPASLSLPMTASEEMSELKALSAATVSSRGRKLSVKALKNIYKKYVRY